MGKKILIIAPQWIGDAVASVPLIQLIAERYQASIDVMAGAHVAALYRFMPEIAQIHEVRFAHGALELRERYQEAKKYKNDYVSAWILPNSFKSALIPWFAQIPQRVGYAHEGRSLLLTHRLAKPNHAARPLMTRYYANLLQAVGEQVPQTLPACNWTLDKADQKAVWRMFNLNDNRVVLCPGAEFGSAKQWPLEHWIGLAQELLQQGYNLLILGTNKENSISTSIENAVNDPARLLNLCGKTSLLQASVLLASSQLVISNDSGLMHIAAAFKRPTLGIFGSSDPRHTPPAGIIDEPYAQTISLELECSPCFKRECPLKHRNCLTHLTPTLVLEKLERMGTRMSEETQSA